MGAAAWAGSALSAFFLARIIPIGRRNRLVAELMTALVAGVICGALATALDFGGWREPEWRAAAFAFAGSLAAVAFYRAARLLRVHS